MQFRPAILPTALIVLALASGQPAWAEPAASAERPLTARPYTPSLDNAVMGRSVDPCMDLYRFSCGKGLEKNPIPADKPSWSVYAKTSEENRQFLWGLLEEAARPDPGRDAATQKIGDYFASCMDEPAIEKAGAAPLKSDLAAIDALAAKDALASLIGRLHLGMDTSGMLFGFGSEQDFKNATQVIGFATAGGLGLPDRDYYTKDDAKSQETRKRYGEHVAKILRLLGEPEAGVKKDADTVLRIETNLARASLTRVDRAIPTRSTTACIA